MSHDTECPCMTCTGRRLGQHIKEHQKKVQPSGEALQPPAQPCALKGCLRLVTDGAYCNYHQPAPPVPLDALALVDAYDAACAGYNLYVQSDKPSSGRRIEAKLKRGATRAALLSAYRPPDLSQWKALGIKSANEFVELKPPRFDHAEQCIWIELGSAYRPQAPAIPEGMELVPKGYVWITREEMKAYSDWHQDQLAGPQAQPPGADLLAVFHAWLSEHTRSCYPGRPGTVAWEKILELRDEMVKAVSTKPQKEAHEADTREALAIALATMGGPIAPLSLADVLGHYRGEADKILSILSKSPATGHEKGGAA